MFGEMKEDDFGILDENKGDDPNTFDVSPGPDLGKLRENRDGGLTRVGECIGRDGVRWAFCRCISANS